MSTPNAASAAEPITLNEGQQAAYDEIVGWIEARFESQKDPKNKFRTPKSQEGLSEEFIQWFGDNTDDYYVLRGFAGTGKSTLTSKLMVDLSERSYSMIGCAPTNRAVGVIQEKARESAKSRVLNVTFKSIHSACGLRMSENDDGELTLVDTGSSTLAEFQIAFVDEASMADRAIVKAIRNCRGNCLIIFIGDPAQFPPVMDKTISRVFKLPQIIKLPKITRQAEGNPLIQVSMKIREKGRADELIEASEEMIAGMGQLERVTASDLLEWMPAKWMVRGSNSLIPMALDFQRAGQDARIIGYTNANVLRINQAMHFDLYPESGSVMFSAGERVIVQSACTGENVDTGKPVDLVTSEELVIQYVEKMTHPKYVNTKVYQLVLLDDLDNLVIVYVPTLMTAFKHRCGEMFAEVQEAREAYESNRSLRNSDKLKELRGAAWGYKKALCEIRHTYAMTAHKMQGSTVDVCLIDLPNLMTMQSALEFNSSLYVSVTRPRYEAYIGY